MDELDQRIFDAHEELLKNANEMLSRQQEISDKWEKLAKTMITGINLCMEIMEMMKNERLENQAYIKKVLGGSRGCCNINHGDVWCER